MDLERAVGAVILMGVLLFVIVVIFILRERYRREEERQRLSDAAFEAEVLGMTSKAPSPTFEDQEILGFASQAAGVETVQALPPLPSDGAPENIPAFISNPVSPVVARPEDFHRQPADVSCAAVLRQMENAGMVEQHEGFMELHGNPRAAVTLKLKGGVRCLIVPYFETEVFTQRNLKRFQMLVYVGRDGKGTVMNSLEEVIAAKVAGRAGM